MLSLDDERWQRLGANGPRTCNFLRTLAATVVAMSSPAEAGARNHFFSRWRPRREPTWDEVWTEVHHFLIHQGTIYPVTIAALPHLAALLPRAGAEGRLDILLLAGWVATAWAGGELVGPEPSDLLADFHAAISQVRTESLGILHGDIARGKFTLPYALQAFAAVRHPLSATAWSLQGLVEDDCELDFSCVSCGVDGVVSLADRPTCIVLNRGDVISFAAGLPQREMDATALARGRTILGSNARDPEWPLAATPDVLAALAEELGDTGLARRILDLRTGMKCLACQSEMSLLAGVARGAGLPSAEG